MNYINNISWTDGKPKSRRERQQTSSWNIHGKLNAHALY